MACSAKPPWWSLRAQRSNLPRRVWHPVRDPPGRPGLWPFIAVAGAVHVPATRTNDIVRGRRGVSADTAMRLARYFRTSERFWLNLQLEYELRQARLELADRVRREIKPRAA